MNIYVAAPWNHRYAARDAADQIEKAGYVVVSRWLREHDDTSDPDVLRTESFNDLTDLLQCQAVVLLNSQVSEGKAVEQGFALANGLRIVAVGKPSNVFHHLPDYIWVSSVPEAITILDRL